MAASAVALWVATPGPDDTRCWAPDIPADAPRIVWLGNSHTYTHDVPCLVEVFAAERGTPVRVVSVAEPGVPLAHHRDTEALERLLATGPAHAVVLQEASWRALFEPERYTADATALADLAQAAGARVVLFEGWAYAQGPERAEWTLDVATEAQAAASTTVDALSDRLDARCAPIGEAFLRAREDDDLPMPISADGNHATREGAVLAAEVLTRVLADDVPTRPRVRARTLGVGESTNRALGDLAADVVARRPCAQGGSPPP